MASSVRGVNRWVRPDATSVTQTLLSITYAKCLPSGLQVKAEATLQELQKVNAVKAYGAAGYELTAEGYKLVDSLK